MDWAQSDPSEEFKKVYYAEANASLAFFENKDPTRLEELKNNYINAATHFYEYLNKCEALGKGSKKLEKLKEAANENWPGVKVNEPKLTKQQQKAIQRGVEENTKVFYFRVRKETDKKIDE